MIILNTYHNLSIKSPTHVTISNWVKKAGYYQIQKSKTKADDWIIIIDESIQIGAEKLLLILGVRESEIDFTKALSFYDVVPVLQVSKAGWNGEEIEKEIRKAQSILGKIKYAVSDRGGSINKALKLCQIPQIHDITHRAGNILKKFYKEDAEFIEFTKKATRLRVKIQQTKWAYLLPPNQRSQSRFLNLKPIVKWAINILEYLQREDENLPDDFPYEKFDWLKGHQEIITELALVISCIEEISVSLKSQGLNKSVIEKSEETLTQLKSKRIEKIKDELLNYFKECSEAVPKSKTLLCTSDIIESCFGKYKNNISKNSLCGITDLSLYIPASTMETGINEIHKIMESVTVEDVKKWTQVNIGQSNLKKRREALGKKKKGAKIKMLNAA